jgi:glycosyltransferase involved in cell wall biosynthesis
VAISDVLLTSYSSVSIGFDDFIQQGREMEVHPDVLRLVTVGSLEQLYKGVDVLIRAVALCRSTLPRIQLVVVGDGRYRDDLRRLAAFLGAADCVTFVGMLPQGAAIRRELDRADLFVLPSRTEGLPRAMIEAMARGLPCIGTSVGGIPELLPEEDMVPPGDAAVLATKILEVAGDAYRRSSMSRRNLDRAKEFEEKILRERRIEFYRHIEQVTARWLTRSGARPCQGGRSTR